MTGATTSRDRAAAGEAWWRDPPNIVVGASVIFALVFTMLSVYRYEVYRTTAFDLGIFDQGAWLLSRFRDPFVTIRGLNLFADHTSFIMVLVAPLYWVWSDIRVLMIVTGLALAAGGPLTYAAGRAAGLAPRWAAVVAGGYLLSPAVAWNARDGFHPEVLAIPLLLWAVIALLADRPLWAMVPVVLVLLTKEDAGLVVVPLGLVAALVWRKRIGWWIAAAGAMAFVLAFAVVLPALSPSGELIYSGRYAALGDGPWQIAWGLVSRPGVVLPGLTGWARLGYVVALLLPLPAALLAPRILLAGLPILAANLLSAHTYQHQIQYHYTSYLIPVIVVAAIYGTKRVELLSVRRSGRWLLMIALVTFLIIGPLPFGPAWGTVPAEADDLEEAIALIPPDATVAASTAAVPHLAHRVSIYLFPTPFARHNYGLPEGELPDPSTIEWIIAETDLPADHSDVLRLLRGSPEFETVYDSGLVVVLRRASG